MEKPHFLDDGAAWYNVLMKKGNFRNITLSIILLLGISFSLVWVAFATAPNPGHNFTEVSGGAAQGDLIYGSAVDTFAALAKNVSATRYLSNTGASNNPAWAQVDLTNGVTGVLPDGNIASALTGKTYNALTLTSQSVGFTIAGGTTSKTLTLTGDATISGNPLSNPMTTLGDIIYGGASGVATRLAGAAGFLKSTGATAPAWSAVSLTADVSGILPTANGGTGIAFFTVAGPTIARVYTFPDAAATVLTSNAAVTVAQGGTGLTAAASDAVLVGDSTSAYTARTLPSSCAGTTAKLLYDSTTNLFSCGTDQTGAAGTAEQFNQSVAAQALAATDTYLTGSSIAIPANSLKVGTRYHLIFNVSKTAAGVVAPIINVRFGTNGSTADTARLTFTFLAQTAAIDVGTFEIFVTFRTVGSGTSAVMQGVGRVQHSLSTTGLQNLPSKVLTVTSAGFDSTVASSIIGVSVTPGTSAAWTVQQVQAELQNLQ